MTSPATEAATRLLNAAVVALGDRAPIEANRYVSHGPPAWDKCREHQIAVYVKPLQHRQDRGRRGGRHTMVQARYVFHLQYLRCVPGVDDNGGAPTTAALNASATALLDDLDAISLAVTANAVDIFGTAPDVLWGDADNLGPNGYVGGWDWPITWGRQQLEPLSPP